jgi:hypothetical protein
MRLVGMALLVAWLLAWGAAPHGEVKYPTPEYNRSFTEHDWPVLWVETPHGVLRVRYDYPMSRGTHAVASRAPGLTDFFIPAVQRPDWRPALRALAVLPLFVLLLGLLGPLRLLRRLRQLAPTGNGALREGREVVEGTLAANADSPHSGLRLVAGSAEVTLVVDGAEVLRASEVRPRDEPRGDAVDVAAGAPVVASGTIEMGSLYRVAATLRAGAGDLVIAGCTLAEAQQLVATRLATAFALLAIAGTTVAIVAS